MNTRLAPALFLFLGGCSLLANPDSIPRPDGGSCLPSCVDVTCGAGDGCGGLCAVGSGCTCTCEGKLCGTGDGCGSTCLPATSTCSCTPSCQGKSCGQSDDCRGICELGSGCTCTPVCVGVPCGFDDGCGASCAPGSGCTAARNSLRELRVELLAHAYGPQDAGGVPDGDGGLLPPANHAATLHSGAAAGADISGSNYRLERLEVSP